MPEKPTAEFWKNIPPIAKVFQEHSLPEIYVRNAPTDDTRLYVPFTETVASALDFTVDQPLVRHPLCERRGAWSIATTIRTRCSH